MFVWIDEAADFPQAERFKRIYPQSGRTFGNTAGIIARAYEAERPADLQAEVNELLFEWSNDRLTSPDCSPEDTFGRRVETVYSDHVATLLGDLGSVRRFDTSQIRIRVGARRGHSQPVAAPE